MKSAGAHSRTRMARSVVLALALAGAVGTTSCFAERSASPTKDQLSIYYTQADGSRVNSWTVPLGVAHDSRSVGFFAALQAIAGPPAGVDAIRFPAGTYVRSVEIETSAVIVALSRDVDRLAGGSLNESGAVKALVWTMTGLPGIDSVSIRVDGVRVATIPGGHFELDEPLRRSDW